MKTPKASMYTIPATARRKLAVELRKRATDKRFSKAERTELIRTAEAWEKTLPKKIIK